MKRTKLLLVAATLTFSTLFGACGSGDDGANNVAACEAYEMQVDSLECYSAFDGMCGTFANTTCDISAYFDCLTANTACMDVGGMSLPDLSRTSMCAPMANCD